MTRMPKLNPKEIVANNAKPKVLVCGCLPPPYFGHSVMYKMLMESSFPAKMQVRFLNMHFWSYQTNKKITIKKILKMVKYYFQYICVIVFWRPQYVLYNSSFYRMPFSKDFLFCSTGIAFGCRFVFHDHGQYVRELYKSLSSWQRAMLTWILRHATGSIVMGARARLSYEGLMDMAKIFIVPGVVEDTAILDVKPNKPTGDFLNVLYFSHMSRSKGVFVALEAVAQILKACRNTMVTFGGPIENNEVALQLERLQKEYSCRVRYLGYVEDLHERTAIFRGADVFMFPTLRDVFGLVLLHAMAESLPIVASREGAIPEIIPDENHGFLFEKGNARALADQVMALLQNKEQRQLMGTLNRRRFEEVYSLEKYGASMIDVFLSL
ncbi:MAG: glycosyltransferase family 4 protein [Candidatus Omnitrophota bacterium]|nr:glycosyltransferase family 4 protein [Candidatus Omnitrophota bacterium]